MNKQFFSLLLLLSLASTGASASDLVDLEVLEKELLELKAEEATLLAQQAAKTASNVLPSTGSDAIVVPTVSTEGSSDLTDLAAINERHVGTDFTPVTPKAPVADLSNAAELTAIELRDAQLNPSAQTFDPAIHRFVNGKDVNAVTPTWKDSLTDKAKSLGTLVKDNQKGIATIAMAAGAGVGTAYALCTSKRAAQYVDKNTWKGKAAIAGTSLVSAGLAGGLTHLSYDAVSSHPVLTAGVVGATVAAGLLADKINGRESTTDKAIVAGSAVVAGTGTYFGRNYIASGANLFYENALVPFAKAVHPYLTYNKTTVAAGVLTGAVAAGLAANKYLTKDMETTTKMGKAKCYSANAGVAAAGAAGLGAATYFGRDTVVSGAQSLAKYAYNNVLAPIGQYVGSSVMAHPRIAVGLGAAAALGAVAYKKGWKLPFMGNQPQDPVLTDEQLKDACEQAAVIVREYQTKFALLEIQKQNHQYSNDGGEVFRATVEEQGKLAETYRKALQFLIDVKKAEQEKRAAEEAKRAEDARKQPAA